MILTGTDRTRVGDTARNLVRRQLPRQHHAMRGEMHTNAEATPHSSAETIVASFA